MATSWGCVSCAISISLCFREILEDPYPAGKTIRLYLVHQIRGSVEEV